MAESEDDLLGAGGPESGGGSARAGVDPFAAAVAMVGADRDPDLSRKAGAYLDEHRELVRLQVKHFHEEHRLASQAARRKRYADRIRNGLITVLAIVILGAAGLFALMVYDAMNDHGLVVEPFSVPPDIAANGLTGEVVASRFLDRLNALQAATESERPADTYQNNWGSQLKVEIPETGISLGELQDILREKLGHVTHITGEVLRTPSGISITARWGEALIAATPQDCYLCARVRAQIAEMKGDEHGAARWFAEAIRLGPSIPFAYSDWGAMLLANGDTEAAIAKFAVAHSIGPHFADPLEMWGEALMLKNRSDLALAKFEEANTYAPNWGRLHLEWGKALFYAGKTDEAKKQFATAARLDLSTTDKSTLAQWMREHG
ncbi:MAG: hypothetical protein ABSD74_04465 [Rhizomicrobium sp.]|jgi:tetratricopeptide (TPR) repeat protein